MPVTKQLLVAIDFYSMENQQQLFGYQHSSKYIFLCST